LIVVLEGSLVSLEVLLIEAMLDASEPRRYAILIGFSKGGFDLKTKKELHEF
jgi:hypothetical protein